MAEKMTLAEFRLAFAAIRQLDYVQSKEDWTFSNARTRELTHCYHDYPARMIPQVAGKLLDKFGAEAKTLFDPYCGTGTSLVEGFIRGINVIGTDLNPLARLIAQAKTSLPDLAEVDYYINQFGVMISQSKDDSNFEPSWIEGISRLDFWFKPEVIKQLERIKHFISTIADSTVRLFFQVAFSETVRESSNTRNDEFKLYRYGSEKLASFSPKVVELMSFKLKRNRQGLAKFLAMVENLAVIPSVTIYDFNTVLGIPDQKIPSASVDIVITSPPYGDSHTTVAYGQYSRLSAAWLGLSEPEKVDRHLMGGKVIKALPNFLSPSLNQALHQIKQIDEKRAFEVASFYVDLQASIAQVAAVLKRGGYACYVVGNRKVKGVVLPTDKVISDFFQCCGFEYVDTFRRAIPNKRMPLKNSPSNVPGALDSTMTQEYIVVMRQPSHTGRNSLRGIPL